LKMDSTNWFSTSDEKKTSEKKSRHPILVQEDTYDLYEKQLNNMLKETELDDNDSDELELNLNNNISWLSNTGIFPK